MKVRDNKTHEEWIEGIEQNINDIRNFLHDADSGLHIIIAGKPGREDIFEFRVNQSYFGIGKYDIINALAAFILSLLKNDVLSVDAIDAAVSYAIVRYRFGGKQDASRKE